MIHSKSLKRCRLVGKSPDFDSICDLVILSSMSPGMSSPVQALSLSLILLILVFAPFAAAQDIHHELAAADTDGHEHSDTDLCQWVQHHTSGSVDIGGPICSAWQSTGQYDVPPHSILFSLDSTTVGPSRAPPHS